MNKRVRLTWRGILGTTFTREYFLVNEDASFVLKQGDGTSRPLTKEEYETMMREVVEKNYVMVEDENRIVGIEAHRIVKIEEI